VPQRETSAKSIVYEDRRQIERQEKEERAKRDKKNTEFYSKVQTMFIKETGRNERLR
jgi:hypothetical protein